MFDVMPALLPHIREGRFRPLAIGSAERADYIPDLKDIPGMAELLPGRGIDALNWWCVAAPAGTPAPVLAQLNGAIRQVVGQEDIARRMLGLTIKPMVDETPEAFGAFWAAQVPVWQALVQESGATAE
jgi:tripartite-type tricarboxylate transporter receptor subunit TctC